MEATPSDDPKPVAADVLEPESKVEGALPVPQGPRRMLDPPKQSFWKRLAPRSRVRDELAHQGQDIQQICDRLTIVEQRLGMMQEGFQERLQALEHRLDEVWEAEEQLSYLVDIQAKLDELLAKQPERQIPAGPHFSSHWAIWVLTGLLTLALLALLGGARPLG